MKKRSWRDQWDGPAEQNFLVLMFVGLPLFAVFLEVVGWVFQRRWVIGWDSMTLSVALTLAAITALYAVLWALDALGRLTFARVKGAWTRRAQRKSRQRYLVDELRRIQDRPK